MVGWTFTRLGHNEVIVEKLYPRTFRHVRKLVPSSTINSRISESEMIHVVAYVIYTSLYFRDRCMLTVTVHAPYFLALSSANRFLDEARTKS